VCRFRCGIVFSFRESGGFTGPASVVTNPAPYMLSSKSLSESYSMLFYFFDLILHYCGVMSNVIFDLAVVLKPDSHAILFIPSLLAEHLIPVLIAGVTAGGLNDIFFVEF